MRSSVKCSLSVVSMVLLIVAGIAVSQAPTITDLTQDQTFEAIMYSVRPDQPQASGFAKIILPSPRWFPLNRFAYVRVEAEGLIPGSSHNIHLHGTVTASDGTVGAGCFAGGPVLVNLRNIVGDANGHGVTVSRIILDTNYAVAQDATTTRTTPGALFDRASLTMWYVQYHVPAGLTGAGSPMACGEVTLAGFDRGAAFK